MAAFLCGPYSTKEDFASMLENGAIKFGIDNMSGPHPNFRDIALLLVSIDSIVSIVSIDSIDSIEDEQKCYVIYLPPYYVVKLAD